MIEPRIYRAAFIPAVLAVVLVMFSLENRPKPVPQGLAADVLFDGDVAMRELRQIVAAAPGPAARAGWPSAAGRARPRRAVPRARGRGLPDERGLVDGERRAARERDRARGPGRARDQIVIMAARDSQSVPDATGSAADTAALLELARVIKGRPSRKTLVLASVDGSTLGDAGARRFARTAEDRDRIEAVIVLSNLGAQLGARPGRHRVVERRPPRQHRAAADGDGVACARSSAPSRPRRARSASSSRLAYPLGLGAQGPLLADGIEAIRISGSGELPPPEDRARARGRERRPARPARPRDAAAGQRARRGRRGARARPALLRRDQPQGAARLGARAAGRDAAAAGARRLDRRLRARAATARGRAGLVAR